MERGGDGREKDGGRGEEIEGGCDGWRGGRERVKRRKIIT